MSFISPSYARTFEQAAAIRELSLVARQHLDDGRDLPSGSEGTIVATWARGAAYEVEFTKPFAMLVTLETDQFRVTAEPTF